jgi:hypothetical protein
MALRLSTGLRNALLQKTPQFPDLSKLIVDAAGNMDFVPSGASGSGNPEIQNTVDDLSVFAAGDIIQVYGSASNDGAYVVTAAAANTLELQEEVVSETGQTCFLGVVHGGALKDIFKNGVMKIFAGSQPASASNDESGYTELCQITLGSGAFTAGQGQNGINFGVAATGTLAKKASETWSGQNGATGVAGWFRFYTNAMDTGEETGGDKVRFDGAVATSGAQLNMSSTSLSSGATTTITSFSVSLPSS